MEITKEISVKITPKELKEIIINHLKKEKGLTITDVFFVISQELDEVRCTGLEEMEKTCTHCGGSGDVRSSSRGMTGYDPCSYCNGTGKQ